MNRSIEPDAVSLGEQPPSDEPRSDLMNPVIRDRALFLLAELGRLHPSLRLGQLVCAIAASANSAVPDSIYDLEDDELIASAQKMIAYYHANH